MTFFSHGFILPSQPNFRDFGLIPLTGNRTITPGRLFRSGDLSMLKETDLEILEPLQIRTVVDFRSPREVAKRPDQSAGSRSQLVHLPIEDASRELAVKHFDDRNAEGLRNILIGDYRRMVREHRPEFRAFFQLLQDGDTLPVVFHCAAGKDRTGLAAWFVLTALGVDDQIIRADYLETNRFTQQFADKIIARTNEKGLHGEILRPLLEVRNEYIDAALEEISLRFGGLKNYLKDELGADQDRLRERLTTPVNFNQTL